MKEKKVLRQNDAVPSKQARREARRDFWHERLNTKRDDFSLRQDENAALIFTEHSMFSSSMTYKIFSCKNPVQKIAILISFST